MNVFVCSSDTGLQSVMWSVTVCLRIRPAHKQAARNGMSISHCQQILTRVKLLCDERL